jgi:hypothetical protein
VFPFSIVGLGVADLSLGMSERLMTTFSSSSSSKRLHEVNDMAMNAVVANAIALFLKMFVLILLWF